MTIYYTSVFLILLIEMLAFGLIVLPLPSRWRRVMFKFATTSPLVAKALSTLRIVFGFIFILFIDAANRLQRLNENDQEGHLHDHGSEASLKATKFYAQRNLYLTGFTLFLSLILERTSSLVISMLKREEELETAREEHVTSTEDQKRLDTMETSYKNKIGALKAEVQELRNQEKDAENLKKQIAQQTEEYNQLMRRHEALKQKQA
ncbi:B-cell receptor-associated protein 31-like-domain-containing protein [Sporodiniella umbellata]|nr:B-cell receptor-associated protein 31-like-domain-containing protein [Sporodiniella umbellata]